MKLGSAENANISHISNNLGYSGTVLRICYKNGGIIGVDYTGGDISCSTLTTRQSFGMYVRSMFKGLFGSGYTGIQTDGKMCIRDRLYRRRLLQGGPGRKPHLSAALHHCAEPPAHRHQEHL